MSLVEVELAVGRPRLEREGRDLVGSWRLEEQASQYHVSAATTLLRSGPGSDHKTLGVLAEFHDLRATDEPVGGWLPVVVYRGQDVVQDGFVLIEHIRPGSGNLARRAHCASVAGAPPANGEILRGRSTGLHTILVNNGLGYDAYVKAVSPTGRASLAFFVQSQTSARITGVPDGSYRIAFATGDSFSRGCSRFLDNMRAQAFDETETFDSRGGSTSELTVTLHPVPGGMASTQAISLEEFDAF